MHASMALIVSEEVYQYADACGFGLLGSVRHAVGPRSVISRYSGRFPTSWCLVFGEFQTFIVPWIAMIVFINR